MTSDLFRRRHGWRTLPDEGDDVEAIITRRYTSPEKLEIADLITEMCEVRHYYAKGVPSSSASTSDAPVFGTPLKTAVKGLLFS